MSSNRWVGSGIARWATIGLGLLTIGLATVADTELPFVFYGSIGSGLLTFMALVHSFAALFRRWMRFADVLHKVAVTTMFAICYLVVVPLFGVVVWLRDPLRLRGRARETAWVARTAKVDALSLERMG
jgi:hypothetical protein